MAKITGPLHSDDARGSIAQSLVFMGWKGVKSCRMWIKPANPKSEGQGNVRCILGGLGKAASKVKVGSAYDTQLQTLGVVPAQQSKQSFLVQYIKNNFIQGTGTTLKTNYAAMLTEFNGHTAKTDWTSEAGDLGLVDFEMAYDGIDAFPKGAQLYLLAKAAIALGFTGTPYTTALASWTSTEITDFVGDLSAA